MGAFPAVNPETVPSYQGSVVAEEVKAPEDHVLKLQPEKLEDVANSVDDNPFTPETVDEKLPTPVEFPEEIGALEFQ
jgi:hypothetical protein